MEDERQAGGRSGVGPVWLPWLFAPLFMAAPIGGCGLAQRWRAPVAAVAEAGAADAGDAGREGWRGRDDRRASTAGGRPIVAWVQAAH